MTISLTNLFPGGAMVNPDLNMQEWKKEQLAYFRNYLSRFREGTQQHSVLKSRIDVLEKLS